MSETISSLGMLIGVYAVFLSTVLPGVQKQCNADPLAQLENRTKREHLLQNRRILFFQLIPMTGITVVLALASLTNLLQQLNTRQELVTQLIAITTFLVCLWLVALSLWYVYQLVRQDVQIRSNLRAK